MIRIRDLLKEETSKKETPYVSGDTYISKEEAGQRFMVETGEDFSQFLGENPLRDAFSIKVSERYLSPEKLKEIKTTLTAIPGVFEVVYVESLIDSIQENIQTMLAKKGA